MYVNKSAFQFHISKAISFCTKLWVKEEKSFHLQRFSPSLCWICGIHFDTWSFSILFAGLQATFLCRVNQSPRRSSTSMDRTGRPITLCASYKLFWHTGWWDRTRLAAATDPLWWRWSHVLSCANCSNLLVLKVFALLLRPSFVTDIQMCKVKVVNNVIEQLFHLYLIPISRDSNREGQNEGWCK